MKKGGYKIIDFKGTALSGTAVDMPGIYDQIVDDYDKPIMVSGVILSGELQDDAYASVKVNDDSVSLTVYGGIITVTEDDEVSFAVSKTNAELAAEIEEVDEKISLYVNNINDMENIPIKNLQSLPIVCSASFMDTVFNDVSPSGGIIFKTSDRLIILVANMGVATIYKGNYDFANHVWTSKSKLVMTELS